MAASKSNPWNTPVAWSIKYLCILIIASIFTLSLWFTLKDAIKNWQILCPSPFPPHRFGAMPDTHDCFYPSQDFVMSFLWHGIYFLIAVFFLIFCLIKLKSFIFNYYAYKEDNVDVWQMDNYFSKDAKKSEKSITWNQEMDLIIVILAVSLPIMGCAYLLYTNS